MGPADATGDPETRLASQWPAETDIPRISYSQIGLRARCVPDRRGTEGERRSTGKGAGQAGDAGPARLSASGHPP